ncbi:MAG: hypothetical protein KUG82_05070 [Pseudomonadales bacterium]|nr:hypothetical protein [Pseudomonadales bacterium]
MIEVLDVATTTLNNSGRELAKLSSEIAGWRLPARLKRCNTPWLAVCLPYCVKKSEMV